MTSVEGKYIQSTFSWNDDWVTESVVRENRERLTGSISAELSSAWQNTATGNMPDLIFGSTEFYGDEFLTNTDGSTSRLRQASMVTSASSDGGEGRTSDLDSKTIFPTATFNHMRLPTAIPLDTATLDQATVDDNATVAPVGEAASNNTNVALTGQATIDNATAATVGYIAMCPCDCRYAANLKLYRNASAVNITSEEVQKELKIQVTNLQKQLSINKTNLSSAKRKKTSMIDDRASARGVGLIGVGMLVLLMGGLVLMDLTTIKRDFQRLRDNLGHCCKQKVSPC